MPRLVLVKHNEVPPESGDIMGYRYTHPETGHISHARDIPSWLEAINKYRSDNGFSVVDPADCINQLCQLLPQGWCKYETGERPSWYVNTRLGVMDVLRGTQALANFIVSRMKVVDKTLASQRALTCSRCYFNVDTAGCAPCVGLAEAVVNISGDNKTPSDPSLKSCAVCSCSVRAKVWMPIDTIAKSTTEEQMQRFPDFCWQKREINAMSTESK